MSNELDVEVFAVGEWGGNRWSARDLDEMAANHAALASYIKPPVKLGHCDRQVLGGQRDGQPALGWVARLHRVGDKLMATLSGIPDALHELIEKGRYRRVSAEIYQCWEATATERNLRSGVRGTVLSALALLGADIPEVKTLEDLAAFLATEGPLALTYSELGAVSVPFDRDPMPRPASGVPRRAVEFTWNQFQTSGTAADRRRLSTALAIVSDTDTVPASVLAYAEHVDMPGTASQRLDLWENILNGESPTRETVMQFNASAAESEVERLAAQVVARHGWPRESEDAWRRARQVALAENPRLDPNVVAERQLREAVRIVCRENGLNPSVDADRRRALVMLMQHEEYDALRPVTMRPARVAEPAPMPAQPVPPIPEPLRPAIAKLSEQLGLSWSSPTGRHYLQVACGRQFPGLAEHLPKEYRQATCVTTVPRSY